jgi:putative nucleotidyltransferase with HDIG domain
MTGMIKIPTETECFSLIQEYNMLPNIIEHSIQVKNVSLIIYDNLNEKDTLNRELIIASALLHDIAKTSSIINRELRHDLKGGEILRELGYDEIAEIVESHVIFSDFDPNGPVTEKEIIYYADKRVMHDQIVTIDSRIADLVKRYGKTEKIREMIINNTKFVKSLEAKIRSRMSGDIDALLELE